MAPDNQSKQNSNWPDFIGIGAIKSGTTWLHACLAEHPDIFTPATKELEYFSARYELGITWYQDQFHGADGRLTGESTPTYMHNPACADRIYAQNPNARLIVCLRNPVDRAFSHFMMKNRESNSSAADKLEEFDSQVRSSDSKYVSYGRYAEQLQPYVGLFGADRIRIVLFEDINANPGAVMRDVFSFLGVNVNFVPSSLNRKINPAAKYKNATAFSYLRNVVRFTERNVFPRLILRMKTSGFRDRVMNWWRVPRTNAEMLTETRTFLRDYYSGPNHQLEQLTGLDLSLWQIQPDS